MHLSGPNAHKTALTVLKGDLRIGPLKIGKVYEKIGAFGTLFSDERLVEILNHGGPFAEVFIDCPLTLPPCVACQRPACPGAVQCDDVAVAFMLAISSKVRRRGARKARPVNPQSQRLWDVLQLEREVEERLEPSYSANLAPLVARARTLQRRLNALQPRVALRETSIAHTLEALAEPLELSPEVRLNYRNFEIGRDCRGRILEAVIARGWIDDHAGAECALGDGGSLSDEDSVSERLSASVEVFHAFIAALVGALRFAGQTREKPSEYVEGEGWVYLPLHPVAGSCRSRE